MSHVPENDRDGRQPDGRRAQIRLLGAALVPIGLALGYWLMWLPLAEARRTGSLNFHLHGLLLPPAAVYAGLGMFFFDLRDDTIRYFDEQGDKHYTKTGRLFLFGMVAVLGVSLGLWFWYAHTLGFDVLGA